MKENRNAWILVAAWLSLATMILLCFYLNQSRFNQVEQKVDRHLRRASNIYNEFINKPPPCKRKHP